MDILLINVPTNIGKKPYDLAFPFVKKLNFGLLAIATMMKHRGYEAEIFDPQVQTRPNEDIIVSLLQYIKQSSPFIIGLSCISGFSYPACLFFAEMIRKEFPFIKIIVGGKDHIGQLGKETLLECPAIDIVVRGEAEDTVCLIIDKIKANLPLEDIPNIVYRLENKEIYFTAYDVKSNPPRMMYLDYKLYPEFEMFSPSLEISRGCTFGCDFCVSAKTGVRKKSIEHIINESLNIINEYEDKDIQIYFETPMLLMSDEEIEKLISLRSKANLCFTWRTETRVDYLTPNKLKNLWTAGLRVVDLGLESACPDILLRMGKTRSPESYLQRAKDILQIAYDLGIIVKLNILFYIGETPETICTTLKFLEDNLPYVTSVSAYPLLLYPGSSLEGGINKEIDKYGGSIIKDPEWSSRHLWPINPSTYFTYNDLHEIGLMLTKSFQTMETFFKQKIYGYFSPNTSFEDFSLCVEKFGIERLPFARNEDDSAKMRNYLWRYLKEKI